MEIGPHSDCTVALAAVRDLADGVWTAPGTDIVSDGGSMLTFSCSVVGREATGATAPIYRCVDTGDRQDWFKFAFT